MGIVEVINIKIPIRSDKKDVNVFLKELKELTVDLFISNLK